MLPASQELREQGVGGHRHKSDSDCPAPRFAPCKYSQTRVAMMMMTMVVLQCGKGHHRGPDEPFWQQRKWMTKSIRMVRERVLRGAEEETRYSGPEECPSQQQTACEDSWELRVPYGECKAWSKNPASLSKDQASSQVRLHQHHCYE